MMLAQSLLPAVYWKVTVFSSGRDELIWFSLSHGIAVDNFHSLLLNVDC
jgi:hypothetical protein